MLHLSRDGRAACDGRELSRDLDSQSPECEGERVCPICWLLDEHYRRCAARGRKTRKFRPGEAHGNDP